MQAIQQENKHRMSLALE